MGKRKNKKVKDGVNMEEKQFEEVEVKTEVASTIPEEVTVDMTNTEVGEVVTAGLDQVIEEPKEEVIEVVESKGVVTECSKLFVRTEPKRDCNPAGIINENDEVIIDIENSTEDYYKVVTTEGLEGYCLKTYIKLV